MTVGRMLNRTVGLDQELNAVSLEAQLLFLMSIPHLDRDGLIIGELLPHLGTVLPLRPEFIPRYENLLAELLDKGIVIRYPTKKGRVLFFPGFRKNQTLVYPREAKSVFDPPPGYVRTSTGLEPDTTHDLLMSNSGVSHDLLMSNSGVSHEEYTLKISKDKESEDKLPPDLGFATGSKPRQKLVEKHSARNGTLDPKIRLPLVDSLLDVYGLTAMVNAGEDQRLQEMHDQAVLFHGMGYTTAEDIQALGAKWYEIDWRGQRGAQPTPKQFVEFASKRAVKQSPLVAVTYQTIDPITGEQAEQIVMERAK